jgi:glycosyltransferase involved in cell wall biosynthesis
LRVTYYHRHSTSSTYSLERVFHDIRQALPEDVEYRISVARFESRGFWRRVYNITEAVSRQADVNHITGDVHYLACLLRKNRTLLTIADCAMLEKLKGIRKLLLFFFWYWLPEKRSALISVISESTKREVLKYLRCNPDKIRVVHCCISPKFKPFPSDFNAKKPLILQVGTSETKNLLRVVEALKGIPCHLLIVGRLSKKQEETLRRYRVEFSAIANISDKEIVEVYRQCDMLLFASTYEGFGLPIIEANATGRPVVTSNILSMPEVAGDAACLVNPFDVESIRGGLLRLIQDAAYREQLVQNGFKNVERFRPHAIAQQYVELYKKLLRESHNCGGLISAR